MMKHTGIQSKVPLINPHTGHLVREAEAIFVSWFDKYSIPASEIEDLDLEKSIPAADRYMTKQTALDFLQNSMNDARNSNGMGKVSTRNLTLEDSRIADLFRDHDLDKDGMLTA